MPTVDKYEVAADAKPMTIRMHDSASMARRQYRECRSVTLGGMFDPDRQSQSFRVIAVPDEARNWVDSLL
jgi:hypothetical protein